MAKRFTDTDKYKKPFIRGLKGAYKLLWDYLYLDCSHAGIWIVDFDIAQIYIGLDMPINKEEALSSFNTDEIRIVELNNGKQWFLPSFIEFQYGRLNPQNRAHNSVIQILKKQNLWNENKGLIRGLQAPMDKDKVKDMDKEEEKEAKKCIPTEAEFLAYAKTLEIYKPELDFSIKAKYEAWKEAKWKDGNGKPIKNWKTKFKNTIPFLRPVYNQGESTTSQSQTEEQIPVA